MAIIRWILGRLILLVDALTAPIPPTRSPQAQAELDGRTAQLALYQFQACPFCVKVRRFMRRHGLNIETRDAKGDPARRSELEQGGGQIKVPCLQIREATGEIRWLYESDEIIRYLEQQVLVA